MSSRILLSITFSTLLLMFVVTSAVQVADGHGGAGAGVYYIKTRMNKE